MTKNLSFLVLLITVSSTLFSQDYLIEPTVIEVDSSHTKEDIYTSVQVYLAEVYGDQREVIRLADPDQGLIVGKGLEENYTLGIFGEKTPSGFWEYTFKIEVKDGRYRYSIYEIYLANSTLTKKVKYGSADELYGSTKKRYEELPAKLKAVFEKIPISSTSTDDW
jgi:hypothetical protein